MAREDKALNLQQKQQALQIAATIAAANQQFGLLRCHITETSACLQAVRLIRRMEQVLQAVAEKPQLLDTQDIGIAADEVRAIVEESMRQSCEEGFELEADAKPQPAGV
ncbi:MAG: hypothetical protein E6Q97_30065 [Desulfurellales bacterium]|nr:MAG: hypothetical protein E6Q97_30065 [Desulfurellales bacterium]